MFVILCGVVLLVILCGVVLLLCRGGENVAIFGQCRGHVGSGPFHHLQVCCLHPTTSLQNTKSHIQ